MSSYVSDLEKNFSDLSDSLFAELKAGEELNINLNAEESTFLRFNRSQVRQNTHVDQKILGIQFQAGHKKISFETTLSGQLESDRKLTFQLLDRAREEAHILPEDPFVVPLENRGESHRHYPGVLPSAQNAIENVTVTSQGQDFVGLYASGPVIRANRNSKGQKHWFSTESFFIDYSLFTTNVDGEKKAVKGVYADSTWDESKFKERLAHSGNQLSLTRRKSQVIKPGEYRTYLAPAAVSELCGMLAWNTLSYSALKKGSCAFAKLSNKEKTLSPLFNLKENFNLGLSPQFSHTGEIAPDEISLIEQGQLKQMLVSARTEKEYGVKSNGSDSLRSPEIGSGQLNEVDALKSLDTGLYLSNLHYLNWSDIFHARLTGMTRYACFWVEKGEVVGPIQDMRFDESLYRIFGQELEALTREQHVDPTISTYFQRDIGGKKIPGALIGQFSFTL